MTDKYFHHTQCFNWLNIWKRKLLQLHVMWHGPKQNVVFCASYVSQSFQSRQELAGSVWKMKLARRRLEPCICKGASVTVMDDNKQTNKTSFNHFTWASSRTRSNHWAIETMRSVPTTVAMHAQILAEHVLTYWPWKGLGLKETSNQQAIKTCKLLPTPALSPRRLTQSCWQCFDQSDKIGFTPANTTNTTLSHVFVSQDEVLQSTLNHSPSQSTNDAWTNTFSSPSLLWE